MYNFLWQWHAADDIFLELAFFFPPPFEKLNFYLSSLLLTLERKFLLPMFAQMEENVCILYAVFINLMSLTVWHRW